MLRRAEKPDTGVWRRIEEKLVGSPMRIGERALIPVVEVSGFYAGNLAQVRRRETRSVFLTVAPSAIVVVDPLGEVVLSLQDREVSLNELVNEVPILTDRIEEARSAPNDDR